MIFDVSLIFLGLKGSIFDQRMISKYLSTHLSNDSGSDKTSYVKEKLERIKYPVI